MRKIKRNDRAIILTGKDKKKIGVVEKVMSNRVLVRGVNAVKKHQRGNPNINKPGGIITKNLSVHISNVGIVNGETNKIDRVRFKLDDKKKKIRIYKSNGKNI